MKADCLMIKSNRCNFFSLSYLEMCSKTNFPTSLKKFYMYRYMLASLSKMTYVEVNIHFSQIRCCFIQSFDYVTHYMIIKKYLFNPSKMDLNRDRSYLVAHSIFSSDDGLLECANPWLVRYYLYEL